MLDTPAADAVAPAGAAPATAKHREEGYLRCALACAVVAGAVHLAVAPEHFVFSTVVGGFFVAVAFAQLALARLLGRTTNLPVVLAGIWGNVALVALYVASRTAELRFLPVHVHGAHHVEHLPVTGGVGNGVPVFPQTSIEPVGLPDLVCLVAELGLVMLLVGLLPARTRQRTTTALMCLGAVAVLLRLLGD